MITGQPSRATVATPRSSPVVRFSLWTLRGYKLIISPYFTGACRFVPSCADYAAEAIARHGIVKGYWLTLRRLSRCHPLCASGYDPVPTEY